MDIVGKFKFVFEVYTTVDDDATEAEIKDALQEAMEEQVCEMDEITEDISASATLMKYTKE